MIMSLYSWFVQERSWPPKVYLQKLCLPVLNFQINLSCSSGVFSWFLVFTLCLGVLRLAFLIHPLESKKYLRKGFFSFVSFFVIVVFYSHSKNTKVIFSSSLDMKLIFSALNIWDYGQAFCSSGVWTKQKQTLERELRIHSRKQMPIL